MEFPIDVMASSNSHFGNRPSCGGKRCVMADGDDLNVEQPFENTGFWGSKRELEDSIKSLYA